ncbi:MAG: methyltransferase domain-containing protein, partial [Actinobacteria bacterium]|nr:methyltransferase domain-containing protein [Actinomycetota bacterium]
MSRADLGKDPEEVAAMFDGVARRYDLFNDLLSLGATKRWRRRVEKIIDPKPGMKILDIAAGPGSSSEGLHKAGAEVTSLDFSKGMLDQGRKVRPYLNFVQGDALNLAFKENTFDLT